MLAAKSSAYSDRAGARVQNQTSPRPASIVLGPFAYSDGDKDFRAQLTAIRAADPDAIFVPGYSTEVALICQQARALGYTVPDARRRRLGSAGNAFDRRQCRGRLLLRFTISRPITRSGSAGLRAEISREKCRRNAQRRIGPRLRFHDDCCRRDSARRFDRRPATPRRTRLDHELSRAPPARRPSMPGAMWPNLPLSWWCATGRPEFYQSISP